MKFQLCLKRFLRTFLKRCLERLISQGSCRCLEAEINIMKQNAILQYFDMDHWVYCDCLFIRSIFDTHRITPTKIQFMQQSWVIQRNCQLSVVAICKFSNHISQVHQSPRSNLKKNCIWVLLILRMCIANISVLLVQRTCIANSSYNTWALFFNKEKISGIKHECSRWAKPPLMETQIKKIFAL